jgi:hypothetical protein
MTDKLLTSKDYNIQIRLTDDKQAFARYIGDDNFTPYQEFYTNTTDEKLKGFLNSVVNPYINNRNKE